MLLRGSVERPEAPILPTAEAGVRHEEASQEDVDREKLAAELNLLAYCCLEFCELVRGEMDQRLHALRSEALFEVPGRAVVNRGGLEFSICVKLVVLSEVVLDRWLLESLATIKTREARLVKLEGIPTHG